MLPGHDPASCSPTAMKRQNRRATRPIAPMTQRSAKDGKASVGKASRQTRCNPSRRRSAVRKQPALPPTRNIARGFRSGGAANDRRLQKFAGVRTGEDRGVRTPVHQPEHQAGSQPPRPAGPARAATRSHPQNRSRRIRGQSRESDGTGVSSTPASPPEPSGSRWEASSRSGGRVALCCINDLFDTFALDAPVLDQCRRQCFNGSPMRQ